MKPLFKLVALLAGAVCSIAQAADLTTSANVDTFLQGANFSAMRTSLGVAIGTDVEAWDADLDLWAAVTPATGIGTFLAAPSGANLASALTSALPATKGGTGLTSLGTGVATALGINVGTAGAPVVLNGAGGTPSSITLTNGTGLPIAGITGLGTGVGTALAINVGSAGAPVLFNGAGGTPSSITLTNASGTASININGTVGATTPAAGTFTTLTSTGIAAINGATASSSTALILPASTTGVSSIRLPHGTAPTAPVNGDIWTTTSGLLARINGATVSFGTGGTGTVTVVSSGSLTSTALVTGGGSQTLQTPSATSTLDSSGNMSLAGSISSGVGGSAAGYIALTQGTAPTAGTTSITLYAPASVTSYIRNLPGVAGTGFYLGTNSAGVVTDTQVGFTGTGNVVRDTVPQISAIELGAASDTTIARSAAGAITVEGNAVFTAATKADVLDAANFAADAGANDTYVATLSPAITAYVTGAHYRFKAATANTGAATLNLNSLGAKTIKKAAGGITTDLADNDIRSGQWVDVVYDGTNLQMQSAVGNAPAGSGTVTSVGFTGGLISVATATSTPALTVAGTSGGVPYFSSTSAWGSSALLATNAIVIGGGAGNPPATTTTGAGVITELGLAADGSDSGSIGFRGIPQNSKSAAYTTVMADAGKHIFHPAADTTARTFTIDSNANVAYPVGTTITFVNETLGGVVTIAITSDTLLHAADATTGNYTLAASKIATALKITSTKWIISP